MCIVLDPSDGGVGLAIGISLGIAIGLVAAGINALRRPKSEED